MSASKQAIKQFWEQAACGEKALLDAPTQAGFQRHFEQRYQLEPFIEAFAEFARYRGKKVLEIGVGLGADHQRFAQAGADLYGIDLTERAIDIVRQRFQALGLTSQLSVGDVENLQFASETFDLVYAWGVIQHTQDIRKAILDIQRVLKPGGELKLMIYHKYSWVGYMLWLRYALLAGRPWMPLDQVYSRYLESPGTQAFSLAEARRLFQGVDNLTLRTVLTHGDLLASYAGQRHRGVLLSVARKIWPRAIIKTFFNHYGLFMLVSGNRAKKG